MRHISAKRFKENWVRYVFWLCSNDRSKPGERSERHQTPPRRPDEGGNIVARERRRCYEKVGKTIASTFLRFRHRLNRTIESEETGCASQRYDVRPTR